MGWLADRFSRQSVMTFDFFLVAATIPLLLTVRPGSTVSLHLFALLFGFGMGADYMLIPLVAAEQFGVESLARAMGIIIPVTLVGQSWSPYLVAMLRAAYGNYWWAMGMMLGLSILGALAILMLPGRRLTARAAE